MSSFEQCYVSPSNKIDWSVFNYSNVFYIIMLYWMDYNHDGDTSCLDIILTNQGFISTNKTSQSANEHLYIPS